MAAGWAAALKKPACNFDKTQGARRAGFYIHARKRAPKQLGGDRNGCENQTAPHGRKKPLSIVWSWRIAASPRDGRFIEEIGYYDPTKEPSVIKIDGEKAKKWIANGAQPTDTVRALLKKTEVL